MSTLEIAANLITTISILLAGRNSLHTWWTGIIGCVLFGFLFHGAQLYADALLQVFFVLASAVGWWHWQRGGVQRAPLPVTRATRRIILLSLVGGTLAATGYGWMLHAHTDAYSPFVDSAVLAFSVVAQLLLMQRKLESWPFWFLVNSLAIPLFISRGLHVTAALYAVYWVNSLISWRYWSGLARKA